MDFIMDRLIPGFLILLVAGVVVGIPGGIIFSKVMKNRADYSNGERVGTLVKFSEKGSFCKTSEGSLNLGQVDEKGQAALWDFSIDPLKAHSEPTDLPQDFAKLIGKRVSVKYVQRFYPSPCRGDEEYLALEVREVR